MSKDKSSSSILTQPQTPERATKLKKLISAGIVYKQEIADLNESLKEAVDEASKELGIDKKVLNDAINTVFKENYYDKSEKQAEVEAVLSITGFIPEKE